MKRTTLTFLFLALLATSLVIERNPIEASNVSQDYCFYIAEDTCTGMRQDATQYCLNNGGSTESCACDGWRAYNACMKNFGCQPQSEQFMIQQGCGPQ